jgi:hypothetical protein
MIVVRKYQPVDPEAREGRCKTVPSPGRISELCAKIRKDWTPRERKRRAGQMRFVELLELPLQSRRKGFWGD